MGKVQDILGINESVTIKRVSKSDAKKLEAQGKLVISAYDSQASVMFNNKSLGSDGGGQYDPISIDGIRIDGFEDWKKFGKKYNQKEIYFSG